MTTLDGITYTDEEILLAGNLLPYTWVLNNGLKNEVGMPIDFEKRPYLKDIYNDLSPKQVLLKPPQIGATVMSTLKCFFVAYQLGKDIIYTLPTDTDVKDIVGGSVNRIIAQNPILQAWVRDHDSVEQKSVGSNLIRWRGTYSPKKATMVPSSLNVHDEVDNSNLGVLTLYQTRQEAQEREEDKWQWYFSHPSLSGHGVDIQWQQSDQKEWHITCRKCGHEQVLQFPDNIDMQRQCYICSSCKAELAESDRLSGRWINKDSVVWDRRVGIVGDYKFSGWHVSQLMLFNKTAKSIIDAFNDPLKDKQYFWNYVLGYPYVGSSDRIDPETVLLNCTDIVNAQTDRPIIGVDTGLGLHYVVMNKQGVFYYDHQDELTATKNPYDALRLLMNKWPKAVCVFDQGGELMLTRQFQQEFPGRVFLCYYNKDKKSIEMVEWGDNEEYWKVRVDRNRMMTLMVEQLRDVGRIILNGSKEEWYEFAAMFGNIYRERIVTEEKRGKDDASLYGQQYVWKRKGADHFCHALLYAIVGMQRYGGDPAKIVDVTSRSIPGAWSPPPNHPGEVYAREAAAIAGIPASAFAHDKRVI